MRKKILLAMGGVVFAFFIGEITARIVLPLLPDPADGSYVGDDACMYRLMPSPPGRFPENHDEHINQYGFRDRTYPVDKPAASFRVLGLGDSFVYGAVPIHDNFLRVAERELNNEERPRTDIILMGVPGWSTENQLGVLEDFGLDLHPDLVVVNFFVGNDVTGIPVRSRVIRGNVYPRTSPLPIRNLLRKSDLFVMFESLVLRNMMQRLRGEEIGTALDLETAGPVPVSDLYLNIVPHSLPVFEREPGRATNALWTEAENYLKGIDEACQAAKIPWLLVLIPDEMQVDPSVRSQVVAALGLSADHYDFDAPQKRLQSVAGKWGVPVLDLLPVMRASHRSDARLYVPNDTHWNERGNLIAGQAVAEAVSRLTHQ